MYPNLVDDILSGASSEELAERYGLSVEDVEAVRGSKLVRLRQSVDMETTAE